MVRSLCAVLILLLLAAVLVFIYNYSQSTRHRHSSSGSSSSSRLPYFFEPERAATISVTMDEAQENVKIEWNYRTVSAGSYYLIEILGRDGDWYVEEEGCDGTNSTIIAESQCSVSV